MKLVIYPNIINKLVTYHNKTNEISDISWYIYRDKDFSTSEIGFSTFFEKGPKNAGFTTLKLRKNKISKFLTF
jgi:hypothetical protein